MVGGGRVHLQFTLGEHDDSAVAQMPAQSCDEIRVVVLLTRPAAGSAQVKEDTGDETHYAHVDVPDVDLSNVEARR